MTETTVGTVEFFVEGKPVPKMRARAVNRGFYTPAPTVHWEELVGWNAKIAMKGRGTMIGPVHVDLVFYGANPQADGDNLCKSMLDAMNKIVFWDDKQVKEISIEVVASKTKKGVQVLVREVA